MIIRPAVTGDFATVKSWLRAARLPCADLGDSHMANFLVATDADTPVGIIGLEQFDDAGLLRSLVVDPKSRGAGIGQQLVATLELHAASQGVEELWLLTIDADTYFETLGYLAVDRNEAPDAIRGTAEFSKLCPGDAVLMKKQL